MADFSVSLHEDDSFNLDHDNRKYLSKNIDPERVSENISYAGNIPLREFYEQTFQASYEEYRAKKTKERGKTFTANWPEKYYDSVAQKQAEEDEKLRKAKLDGKHGSELADKKAYTKIAKQIIIQIGNTDDLEAMGPEEQKKTREAMIGALKEYMDTFQKENPNFRIVNAVIHVDEISLAPHLHLTYVPVQEASRGQKISNSLRGALKQMGFVDQPKTETAPMVHCQTLWQTKERERVIEIAGRHGLDVGYQKGNKGRGQTIGEYRAAKQAEREAMMEQSAIDARKEELAQVQADIDEARDAHVKASEDLYDVSYALENAEIDLKDTEGLVAKAETTLKQKEEQIQEKHTELENLTEQVNELPATLNRSVDKCERDLEEKLIPPVSPSDNYERVTKGAFGKKQVFVMVPEKDYEVLERRNGLKPQVVKDIIRETLQPLRDAITKLPVVRNLLDAMQRLEQEVGEWKKRFRKAEREKEALQKENMDLKTEKSVADRVMYKKLGLAPHVIDKMKADAAKEILQEQQRDDGDVLGW